MALSVEEIKLMIPQLLRQVPKERSWHGPRPATLDDIRKFETENEMSLSRDVVEWLMTENGIQGGPSALLNGVSGREVRATKGALTSNPEWNSMNWFPLGEDGCGNCYVSYPIDRLPDRRPVCFVDTADDPLRIAYVVASSVWHFLYFILNEQMGDERWPFNKDYVLEQDPTIQEFTELPMPWADESGSA
ncbi:MAG TPA: SMI1/KNR4 family protein [Xanthobacteraceae bacterium]|nr:SMI1/KNR4 family protein [Xanthobacteraceae bacterium]